MVRVVQGLGCSVIHVEAWWYGCDVSFVGYKSEMVVAV